MTAEAEDRIAVATQWQLMWWRFRKHKLAVGGTLVLVAFYFVAAFADFFAYADPSESEAQRSLMAPQSITWFDDGRFKPYVHPLKGTRDPKTFKRVYLLDELRKPYVVTARSKGLSELRVILKYPVRMALNPFASTIGYTLPYIVSGSIIVSLVLGLPTVGPLLLKALIAQDMFLAGTIVLLLGVMTVIGTLISDILLVWVDPRIRLEET